MMDYNLQIQKLLIQVDAESSMANKAALLKQAINIAGSHNDIEWGYDLRLNLMDVCNGIVKNTDALPAFVWVLDACDRNPDLFDEKELLWKYKWMIDSAARNSKISMLQINAILDDFKARLERNGYSLRAYYGILVSVGFITENMSMVKQNIDLRAKCERDNMSDSSSHDLYDRILYLLMINEADAALALEGEMRQKNKGNIGNTFAINTCYSEFLSRIGRHGEAKHFIDAAEKNFTEILNKECYLMVTLSSLIYALNIVETEKAWQYFEQYAHWIDEGEEYDTLIFGLNILPLLACGGQRRLSLNSHLPFYNSENEYDIKAIFDYFYNITKALAQAFDERNQNNAFAKQIDIILSK